MVGWHGGVEVGGPSGAARGFFSAHFQLTWQFLPRLRRQSLGGKNRHRESRCALKMLSGSFPRQLYIVGAQLVLVYLPSVGRRGCYMV